MTMLLLSWQGAFENIHLLVALGLGILCIFLQGLVELLIEKWEVK